jgi:hypothetical protein
MSKKRADNYGYTNHRVICLVVIGSSLDSEQLFQVTKTLSIPTPVTSNIRHCFTVTMLLITLN